MSDTPTTTVSLAVWQGLHKRAEQAEIKALELMRELAAARAQTDDERLLDAMKLITHLKSLVDHAVANLSPEFIRDIPAEDLEAAAGLIQKTAGGTNGHGSRDYERALVWSERAKLVYDWRDRRKARGIEPVTAVVTPPRKSWWRRLFARLAGA